MAKITRHGGPSFTKTEVNDPGAPEHVRIHRAELGTVDRPSAGNNSETSQEKTPKQKGSQSQTHHAPALAGNPSAPGPAELDSSAPSMGGDGQRMPVQQSAKPPVGAPRRRTGTVRRATQDDDF